MNLDKQPIINIGMLGSVSDGKSTTVNRLSGITTQRHSSELKRNITIKPGYANMKIYKDEFGYNTKSGELVHHVSFIDCPGHYQLIVTMMSNIRLMDGIILVVSAAESISMKPQLIQHIMAIKMSGIMNVIVLFNKLDLIKKDIAKQRYKELINVLNKYDIKPKKIIPVCMNLNIGVNTVLNNIMEFMGPKEREQSEPLFMISRSFDINHVNIDLMDIQGGVVGGSMIQGTFKIGDIIEISPGIVSKTQDGSFICKPHVSEIISIKSDTTVLDMALPGGLIGIGTNIDPYYCKNDNMCGMVVCIKNKSPPIYTEFTMNYEMVGFGHDFTSDNVVIIIGTASENALIESRDESTIKIKIMKPMCFDNMSMIIICDNITDSFNIIAYGFIKL